ncbi:hypothetical protein D5S17_29015 [Pseudonocardiaceae bacterium YIM PH 21723]|nr:hypothetical protein D5S17_29015 [Pseudonocardiaceae bacterium YIM PH 21723]
METTLYTSELAETRTGWELYRDGALAARFSSGQALPPEVAKAYADTVRGGRPAGWLNGWTDETKTTYWVSDPTDLPAAGGA